MKYINTLNDKITKHCEVIKTIENQNKNRTKINPCDRCGVTFK